MAGLDRASVRIVAVPRGVAHGTVVQNHGAARASSGLAENVCVADADASRRLGIGCHGCLVSGLEWIILTPDAIRGIRRIKAVYGNSVSSHGNRSFGEDGLRESAVQHRLNLDCPRKVITVHGSEQESLDSNDWLD